MLLLLVVVEMYSYYYYYCYYYYYEYCYHYSILISCPPIHHGPCVPHSTRTQQRTSSNA